MYFFTHLLTSLFTYFLLYLLTYLLIYFLAYFLTYSLYGADSFLKLTGAPYFSKLFSGRLKSFYCLNLKITTLRSLTVMTWSSPLTFYWRRRGSRGSSWGGWPHTTPSLFIHGEEPRYPLKGHQGPSEMLWKIIPTQYEPWTAQPVAIRYTDWAIPAPK